MSPSLVGMDPDQWHRVKEIFSGALERAAADRAAYVAAECGTDSGLYREVTSLLATQATLGDFLERPIARLTESTPQGGYFASGQLAGHYRVLSMLGAGGMGAVYLAEDPRLDRRVALKVLTSDGESDAEHLRRFVLEARAASALSHPNIATIHEIGLTAEGRPFIAMEYVAGLSLRERLHRGRLTVLEALDIALQVTAGLAAAHAGGVVHRDVKPENVMIRSDGLVKLVDFGIAKRGVDLSAPSSTAGTANMSVTKSGLLLGTLPYMSPEQARGIPVDVRTDVWGVGALLYEMVTGVSPFSASSPAEVLVGILERDPTSLDELRSVVPHELAVIITKTLRKDRSDRYQSMAALAVDLRAVQERATEVDREAEVARPLTGGRHGGSARRSWISYLAARRTWAIARTFVLVAILGLVFVDVQPRNSEGLFDERMARSVAKLAEREQSSRGRVFIQTPINHTGLAEHDSLAGTIAEWFARPIADGKVAHVIPRDSVVAIEALVDRELGGEKPQRRLRRTNAFMNVLTVYSLQQDSLHIMVSVQRRTMPSRRSQQLSRSLSEKLLADEPELLKKVRSAPERPAEEVMETWRFAAARAPIGNPQVALRTLAIQLSRALDGMRSCDANRHTSVESVPWCWADENVPQVVPGFWRARTPEVVAAYEAQFRRGSGTAPAGR